MGGVRRAVTAVAAVASGDTLPAGTVDTTISPVTDPLLSTIDTTTTSVIDPLTGLTTQLVDSASGLLGL